MSYIYTKAITIINYFVKSDFISPLTADTFSQERPSVPRPKTSTITQIVCLGYAVLLGGNVPPEAN